MGISKQKNIYSLTIESCPFVTENNKCCKLPFEFNNQNYTECTADGTEKDWSKQWRHPWCFPEDDGNIKHPCRRTSKFDVLHEDRVIICCKMKLKPILLCHKTPLKTSLMQKNKQSVPSASKNEASANKRGKISNPR